jgi:hypothetical protein
LKAKKQNVTGFVTAACYTQGVNSGEEMRTTIKEKTRADEYRTTLICVDAYENGAIRGRMYNPRIKGAEVFDNLMQLLLRLDTLLDELKFPQSFEAKREFGPVDQQIPAAAEEDRREGRTATFAVKILFRQNASWQGSVAWLEGRREESFRSVLELLFLMNSAMASEKSKKVS